MPTPTRSDTPAAHLTWIVTRFLIPAIGRWLYARAITRTTPANATAIGLAQAYAQSLARRFARLEARYLAGTLTLRPRPSRAGAPRATPRKPGRFAIIPRRWGWLTRTIPECAWNGGGPLCDILHRPDTLAMLAAAPRQTARVLRPLARMLLGKNEVPALLLPPPRPRRPRAPDPLAVARAASAWPDHLRAPRHRLNATWKGPGKIFTPPRNPNLKNET